MSSGSPPRAKKGDDEEMEDVSGDVVPTPIFEQVNAPIIKLTSRDFLVDWWQRRQRYLRLLEQS